MIVDDVLAKIFGTRNEREVKAMRPVVAAISDLESSLQQLSDADLAAKTIEFKERIGRGEKLDELLIEAFAVCREAGRRVLNMRHFDVQLIGGMVLHKGRIAEMKTGEGKTLVATLPTYLNALEGKGVHMVTVNDYLAQRDAGWMGPVYHYLGLTAGVIIGDKSFVFDPDFDNKDHDDPRMKKLRPATRKEAYDTDITYGTNNEFGFDYLRDNMVNKPDLLRQRELNFAIVDEV